MAQPIPLHVPPRDPREALRARLERAPDEHAEALLAACALLQELHDKGILDLARAATATGGEALDTLVASANTPETVRALRNLLFWRQVLGRIEPESFRSLFEAIPEGLATATAPRMERVSPWRILRRAFSRDSLRGLAAAVDFLESFGRHLSKPN